MKSLMTKFSMSCWLKWILPIYFYPMSIIYFIACNQTSHKLSKSKLLVSLGRADQLKCCKLMPKITSRSLRNSPRQNQILRLRRHERRQTSKNKTVSLLFYQCKQTTACSRRKTRRDPSKFQSFRRKRVPPTTTTSKASNQLTSLSRSLWVR